MTKDEALKLALEGAANYIDVLGGDSKKYRQLLAQPAPVQEPVAWWNGEYGSPVFAFKRDTPGIGLGNPDSTPLYTIPPAAQRQWVGLTDAEVMQTMSGDWTSQFYFARAIEAKLKEKNT